ncbi:hypothetical protein [Chromobacterium sphagni]|uniref:hypothetical protein n=1 Tax=Chromobacterium sphagni TaxID=1903179 RepID=UPI0011142C3E|nr:hypothetical protein [Chromobacterium sphagni]
MTYNNSHSTASAEHTTEVVLNLEDRNHFLHIAHEAQREVTNEQQSSAPTRKTSLDHQTPHPKNAI